ncbi:MAG: sigma 54-interacting transcriptional regulator [Bryobacterales bacterium]|nr:sigma 54-interacting transcriptional regulator [Bryobacterales bacterium]
MPAELIIAAGPLSGNRYTLGLEQEIVIGRDAACGIRLVDSEVSWRHCVIKPDKQGYLLQDLRSGGGTYVNGFRVTRHQLEPSDHIQLGDTVLLFRDAGAAEPVTVEQGCDLRKVLMGACGLVFLCRAFVESTDAGYTAELEVEILRMIRDFVPYAEGWIFSGTGEQAIRQQCRQRGLARLEPFVEAVSAAGPTVDRGFHLAGAPVFGRGGFGAVIVLRLPESEDDPLDALMAIATLAGLAFENAREVQTLRTANALLEEKLGLDTEILGDSPAVRRLLELLQRVAPRDTTVLILGESGTGKELVARTIHRNSSRKTKPFVAINCAALTDTLLESELFGHEKGAFTGAVGQKKGKLELANGGTVFLDEIGELAPGLQAKLLRVLQQREFERVGGTETHRLDVRLIAATNRDLVEESKKGRFREDLYHRLNVVSLKTPPLRDRREDIPMLAGAFLVKAAAACRRRVTGFTPDALRCLLRYDWPGNVRELENAIERAVVLGIDDQILPEDLPESLLEQQDAALEAEGADDAGSYQLNVKDARKDAILDAYRQTNGNYREAAKRLGIHPNYLLRLVKNMGLKEQVARAGSQRG